MSEQKDLIGDLRERGTRVTPQRAIILSAIEKLPGHFTADEIFGEVQKVSRHISLATVYRTLDMLQAMQLVSESHMGTSTTHYALITHANHHHAVCRNCQCTIELPANLFEPVVETLAVDHNFVADVNHLVIFGWCQHCRENILGSGIDDPA
ncbi:MAG: Fur family transcriptional regulator [Chloroflexota bacterium]